MRGLHSNPRALLPWGLNPTFPETCRMKKILLLIVACAFPIAAWAQDPCSLIRPQTLAPADGAVAPGLVSFRWSVPGLPERLPFDVLPRFDVWVAAPGDAPSFFGSTEELGLTRFLPAGAYSWFVTANVRGCRPLRSAVSSFTIPSRPSCALAPPIPVTPGAGTEVSSLPVTLGWSSVAGADGYVVWIQKDPDAPHRVALTRRTVAELDLPNGDYRWRVEALVSGCNPIPSEFADFRVETCELSKPALITPPQSANGIPSTVSVAWSSVPDATSYRLMVRQEGGLIDRVPQMLVETSATEAVVEFPTGNLEWWIEAEGGEGCRSRSLSRTMKVERITACPGAVAPNLTASSASLSNEPFALIWSQVAGATSYEMEESADSSFSSATPIPLTGGTFARLQRDVGARTFFYYRVRAIIGCSSEVGPWSDPVEVTVGPKLLSVHRGSAGVARAVVDLCLRGAAVATCPPGLTGDNAAATTVTLAADRPWVTLEPSVVTFPANGVANVTVSMDARALATGTNRASINLVASPGKSASGTTTKSTVTVGLTLVSPVAPAAPGAPTPSTLVIPAVAHADGAFGSQWQSDVRLLNTSGAATKYELSFVPSASDGTLVGQTSELDVNPGQSVALDDIVFTWFGEATTGSIFLRPLEQAPAFGLAAAAPLSVASSRTLNQSPTGTFGQFIPAIAFGDFIGAEDALGAPRRISMQQIAQNEMFRTNIGVVEGSGETANVEIALFDGSGTRVALVPLVLQPREHRQLDSIFAAQNVSVEDGRAEITVTSATGMITAYASRIDNRTGDPFVVFPTEPSNSRGDAWVIPGVAAIDTGQASWRTDVRLFNAGEAPVEATLTFYPQGSPADSVSAQVEIGGDSVAAIDGVLDSLFGIANGGGAIRVTTSAESTLVVTAQTYNDTGEGTFGQFIPAVRPDQAVGMGERSLQILQIEESERFRTNLGLVEVSGQPVMVEISAVVPESRVIPRVQVSLAANEFRQLNSVMKSLNLPATYNGRLSVRVLSGAGRLTAYASMVDNATQDPTYVPAQ